MPKACGAIMTFYNYKKLNIYNFDAFQLLMYMHPKTSHLQIPKYFVLAMLFEPVNGYRLIMFPTILHLLDGQTS